MFGHLREWFKNNRAWRAAHLAAWNGATEPGADGLSLFQHECRAALQAEIRDLKFKREGQSEVFLTALMQNMDVKIYIYTDGGELRGPQLDFRAEEWDYETPEELIAALGHEVKARVAI